MKKDYTTPKLVVYGKVEEITRADQILGPNNDGSAWWPLIGS